MRQENDGTQSAEVIASAKATGVGNDEASSNAKPGGRKAASRDQSRMNAVETKVDWSLDKCPTCNGTGIALQTAEEISAAIKRGILTPPTCPACGGAGRSGYYLKGNNFKTQTR
jgi:hypothetical protein